MVAGKLKPFHTLLEISHGLHSIEVYAAVLFTQITVSREMKPAADFLYYLNLATVYVLR